MIIKGIETDISPYCARESTKFGVIPSIHPADHIFRFCVEHECFPSVGDAISYYFSSAADSADKLASIILRNFGTRDEAFSLLEFASGYGAVTRHLGNKLPNAAVTACDIHEEAINFIRDEIGVEAVLSHSVPEELSLERTFDVVFALSFFSHMPRTTWTRWIASLGRLVRDGGHLIFTTHGAASAKHFGDPKVDESGFWFKGESEQKDIRTDEYGMTLTLPKFVRNEITKMPELSIVFSEEAFWWEHQDVYVVKRSGDTG